VIDVSNLIDVDAVFSKLGHQRGPSSGDGRGPGRPWGGIAEEEPQLWITWIVDICRWAKLEPNALRWSFGGVPLAMDFAELTFGKRWFWLCPICQRRCEVVYAIPTVGCRKCLHLGYASQAHRPGSVYRDLMFMRGRGSPHFSSRHFMPGETGGMILEGLRDTLLAALYDLVLQVKVEAAGAGG